MSWNTTEPPGRAGKIVLSAVLAIVAAAFFWLNLEMPRFADDFCRFAPGFDPAGVMREVVHTWLTWSGRFPPMFIAWSTFSLGNAGLIGFDVANAAVLAFVLRSVVRHGTGANRPGRVPALLFCLFLFWFTPARFGETLLWKTGAVQYFWGSALALFAMGIVVERTVWGRRGAAGPWRTALFCLGCFVGGGWLENLSAAVLLAWLLMMAVDWYQRREIDRLLGAGLIAWSLGSLILLIAPGNYARVVRVGYSAGFFERTTTAAAHLLDYLDKGLALVYILFCLVLLMTGQPDARRKLYTSLSFALTGALSVLAMIGAPEISFLPRAAFPYQFFMIVATMALFPEYIFADSKWRTLRRLVAGLATVFAVALTADYALMLRLYGDIHEQAKAREQIVAMAKTSGGVERIGLPPLSFGERYSTINGSINFGRYFARDITRDPNHWRNVCYAHAHGVASVVLVKRDPR